MAIIPYVIPSDSPSIFDSLSVLDKQAIVRPNNPPPGIAGFLFDIPEDEEMRLRSLITKHYIENNTPISDQIALEPEEVKLRGLVAELSTGIAPIPDVVPVPDTLPINLVFVPIASRQQAEIDNEINEQQIAIAKRLNQTAFSFEQSSSALSDLDFFGAQTNAAQYFYQLWKGRMLFSVETPFGIINNMAILDAQLLQEADSREKSRFTITFQKIRTAGDVVIASGQLAGRRVAQSSPTTQTGVAGQVTPTAAQATALYQSFKPWSAAA